MARAFGPFGGAALILCLAGSAARADFESWTFTVSVLPGVVVADQGGSGRVAMAPNLFTGPNTGSADIGLLWLRAFSVAPVTNPDTFTHKAFRLDLTLTDSASHASGTLTFAGEFNGSLSATTAKLLLTFHPTAGDSLTLGRNVYTVGPDLYTSPGPPSSATGGSLGVHVSVQPVPEPSGLVLAGVGVPLLAAGAWQGRCRARGQTPRRGAYGA
jgi:hypothetical protein